MPTPNQNQERATLHAVTARVAFEDIRQQWRCLSGRLYQPAPFTKREYSERLHRLCMVQEQALLRNLSKAITLKEAAPCP